MTTVSNALTDQAESIPDLIREQVPILTDAVRKAVPTPVDLSMRHLILTGCGDSAIAASASELLLRQITGLPVVAEEAMTVARYTAPLYSRQYPNTPTVVALSNSGEVARVVEAARISREVGGYVVAITGSPDSRLAQSASAVIPAKAPKFPSAPGTRSYVTMALALVLFGIRLGEVRGRITMDQAKALRREVAATADAAEAGLTSMRTVGDQVLERWAGLRQIDVLGSGPDRASARFLGAKFVEAAALRTSDVDVEEFFHLNYFAGDPGTIGTVVVAATGSPAASRVAEVAPVLTQLARPTLFLGDGPSDALVAKAPEVRLGLAPLVHAGPISLLAGLLQNERGEVAGRGHQGPWSLSAGATTTRASETLGLSDLVQTDAREEVSA